MKFLAEEKEREEREQARMKRKAEDEVVEELRSSVKRLKKGIDTLMAGCVEYGEKCEATGKVEFITKSNSMRRAAEEKMKELKLLETQLQEAGNSVKQK